MHLLTLPDFYRRRYNQSTETLAVLAMLASNIILVAGNLAGLGLLLDVVFGGGYLLMLITIAACILAYAVTGGLYATIRVSVLQVTVFILGMLLGFFWLIGDNGWTAMISQVPANLTDLSGLFDPGNGAYRNWSYLIALAFGDVVAIDFMQRVISSDSAETARRGCFMGGVLTLIVGIPVALVGLFGFYLEKLPSSYLLVDIAVQNMPVMVGGLLILGIIAASMSTAAGVILDLANIITRNLIQRYRKSRWNNHTMIVVSRLIAFPTMAAAVLFAYVRPEPGILLVLAFDVVLAGCFIPLALGIYWKRSNALGAIASIIVGSVVRIVLYYRIPDVYAGLDTLIPPAISLAVFILVSLATQRVSKPKHEALTYAPTDEELVKGTY